MTECTMDHNFIKLSVFSSSLFSDGIFHDYFQVESRKNAGLKFWAAGKEREEKQAKDEARKGDGWGGNRNQRKRNG